MSDKEIPTSSEISQMSQNRNNSTTTIYAFQNPRIVIEQNIFLQPVFKFLDIFECFENLRLVSKFWKNSIESYRFFEHDVLSEIYSKMVKNAHQFNFENLPLVYQKLLKSLLVCNCAGFRMDNPAYERFFFSQISLYMKNMQEIYFEFYSWQFGQLKNFCKTTVQNSHLTVELMEIERLNIFPRNLSFPKLGSLSISALDLSTINISEFTNFFENMVHHAPNLKTFELSSICANPEIGEYLATHYPSHCVWGRAPAQNFVPIKILSECEPHEFAEIENWKYKNSIEYLLVYFWKKSDLENYEALKFLPNLKAIRFELSSFGDKTIDFSHKFWQQLIQFCELRKIKLCTRKETAREFQNKKKEISSTSPTFYIDFY